jgi:2-keto-4-pentenoate hydratase/2-oxohepta-3-ene-1,7-dioic acid hydratase in catechol pathway
MKLVTVKAHNGTQLGFAAADGSVLPMSEAFELAGIAADRVPANMLDLIQRYGDLEADLAPAASMVERASGRKLADGEFQWMPPLANPPKILGCAINNSGLNKLASSFAQNPPFFMKASSALTGNFEPIVIRPDYGLTHPEGELAVVIGKRCKMVAVEDALDVVFGYTIINDVTSITLKSEDTYVFPPPDIDPPPAGFEHGTMQLVYHARSKNTDTFGPIGPWIVTRDEIADPNLLTVKVFMGDEECTSDSTSKLRFKIQEVIAWASRYFTLEPGDIIHMGTAAKGKYGLRDLDFQSFDGPCTIEISGIGRLTNPIARIDLDGNKVAAQPRKLAPSWPPRGG